VDKQNGNLSGDWKKSRMSTEKHQLSDFPLCDNNDNDNDNDPRTETVKQLLLLNKFAVKSVPNFYGKKIEKITDPLYEWTDGTGFRLPHILVATRTQESFDKFVSWIYIVRALNNTSHYLDAEDKYANTPLHWSMKSTNFRAGVILLDVGADANKKNIDGRTPLHTLALQLTTETDEEVRSEQCHMLIYYLKKNRSSLNVQDNDGRTILHYLAEAAQHVALKIALEFQAEPDVQDIYGNTSLFYAAATTSDNNKECVFHLLVKCEADHSITNKQNHNLLEHLMNINNKDMYYFVHEVLRLRGNNFLIPQTPLPLSLVDRLCDSKATELPCVENLHIS
jgi:ankyrin repeat protein